MINIEWEVKIWNGNDFCMEFIFIMNLEFEFDLK